MSESGEPKSAIWQSLQTLIHIGIDPESPPLEARHVIVVNSMALAALLATILIAPYDIAKHFSPALMMLYITVIVLYLCILFLNSRKQHEIAAVILLATTIAGTVTGVTLQGPASGIHYGFLVEISCAFLVFHHRKRWLAAFFGSFVGLCFGAVGYLDYLYRDILPRPPDNSMFHATTGQVLALVIFVGYYSRRVSSLTDSRIRRERQQYHSMLSSIFPAMIAKDIANSRFIPVHKHPKASIIICDIVGFTRVSEEKTPEELVFVLGQIFGRFDSLCKAHNAEKIRTNGDAYLAVCGLHGDLREGATASSAVQLACEMRTALRAEAQASGHALTIRIGIATGPVTTSLVGKRKRSFDLFGETMVIARQMEADGIASEVVVDPATAKDCSSRTWIALPATERRPAAFRLVGE
mgnify:CR=1 FL=1